MEELRKAFLAVMFLVGSVSALILSMGVLAFNLYIGSEDGYPGSFLISISKPDVIFFLVVSAAALFFRSVRDDGRKMWPIILDIMADLLDKKKS